jgi:hypothetical protein
VGLFVESFAALLVLAFATPFELTRIADGGYARVFFDHSHPYRRNMQALDRPSRPQAVVWTVASSQIDHGWMPMCASACAPFPVMGVELPREKVVVFVETRSSIFSGALDDNPGDACRTFSTPLPPTTFSGEGNLNFSGDGPLGARSVTETLSFFR